MSRRAPGALLLLAGAAACRHPPLPVAPARTLSGPWIELYLELEGGIVEPAAPPALVRRAVVPGLLGGEDAPALFLHPPGRLRLAVEVGDGARFVATVHRPRGFVERGSDGVEARLVDEADGRVLWSQPMPPGGPDSVPVDVDLGALRGRHTVLSLEALPGPGGDARYDSLYLVSPRLEQRVATPDAAATAEGPARTILVTVDTLRQDHLSADGHPAPLSPHVDALSRRGAIWARAYAQANATTPSHAVIMTGRMPHETGVYGSDTPLPADVPTLAEKFRAAGARTAAVVSVAHLAAGMSGLGRGFEAYLHPEATQDATATTDLALGFLSRHRAEPLFLWVHYFDVHTNYEPPDPYRTLHAVAAAPGGRPLPEQADAEADAIFPAPCREWLAGVTDPAVPRGWYAGEVSHVDHEIGRLLRSLRAWGQDRRATVILTSDHGESFTEHGVYYGHAGLFEPQLAVPMILVSPGQAPAVRRGPAAHVDIMGSVAARDGAHSLHGDAPSDRVLASWHAHREALALRRGDVKVVRPVAPHFPKNAGALAFDLAEDPAELRPLGTQSPAHDALAREAAAVALRARPPARVPVSSAELEKLRALGYVQ